MGSTFATGTSWRSGKLLEKPFDKSLKRRIMVFALDRSPRMVLRYNSGVISDYDYDHFLATLRERVREVVIREGAECASMHIAPPDRGYRFVRLFDGREKPLASWYHPVRAVGVIRWSRGL